MSSLDISFDDIHSGVIVDIRNFTQYQMGHYPNAISIPEGDILKNPSLYLNKSIIYYLYCNSGIRSKRCVNYLNSLGYHTVNILGGYQNYLLR